MTMENTPRGMINIAGAKIKAVKLRDSPNPISKRPIHQRTTFKYPSPPSEALTPPRFCE